MLSYFSVGNITTRSSSPSTIMIPVYTENNSCHAEESLWLERGDMLALRRALGRRGLFSGIQEVVEGSIPSSRYYSSLRERHAAYSKEKQRRMSEQGLYLVSVVIGMVGVTYASVPLYRLFCQATGFGGTIKEGKTVEEKLKARKEGTEYNERVEKAAAGRELTIMFNADVSDGLEWKFTPTQRSVKVHPGQSTLAFYTVENLSDKAITGVSTYNVAPQQVGQYFNKVQCFCFEEQRLRAGEKIDMPVFFYIDPEYAVDSRVDHINNITLSYTFFKVGEDDGDDDEQEAHNDPK